MRGTWMLALVAGLGIGGAHAQGLGAPIPLEQTQLQGSAPAPTLPPMDAVEPSFTPPPAVMPQAPQTAISQRPAPPVLPEYPRRRAIEALAIEGGRMSYAGPGGAMTTSPQGGTCAVTCSLSPPEEYQVVCPPGNIALCQCDEPPYAECRVQ